MTLAELLDLLYQTPAIADIHPASLCFLPPDVAVVTSAEEVAGLIDKPEPSLPKRCLITSAKDPYLARFPHVRCDHDPLTTALNDVIFDRFDDLSRHLLTQSQLSDRIVSNSFNCDVVVLFLVDGLSYKDVKEWKSLGRSNWRLIPCLVDVPTITRIAFPNLIGSPTLAERLFDRGFHCRLGFSYWHREDNQLTDQLFHTIVDLNKVRHFDHVLTLLREGVENANGKRCFVQVMRTGLDGYAHSQKRSPPITAVSAKIESEFTRLVDLVSDLCSNVGNSARIYLTADHGILWLKEFEPDIVGSAPSKASPRYSDWRSLHYQSETGRRFVIGGEEYYCLGFPYLRRSPRIDEQGVHGGISFQESIVPFIEVRID